MRITVLASVLTLLASAAWAQKTVTLPATSNLYLAARTANDGDGTPPVELRIPAGTQCIKIKSVQGSLGCFSPDGCVSMNHGTNLNDPDGERSQFPVTNNLGTSLISGMSAPGFAFLAGVFLADTTTGPAPPPLDFTGANGTRFKRLAPLLAQSFFIGDGRRGHAQGGSQSFAVPAGATRLALGLLDTCFGSGDGPEYPGCYGDNTGAYTVTAVHTAHPCEAHGG